MKKTPNQIREELRRQMAKQHNDDLVRLREEKAELEKKYNDLWRKSCEVREERDKLKEQVAQFEDWNRRLQEFMDMSEDDRQKYVENLRTSEKLNKTLERFEYMSHLFSGLFV